MTPGTRIGGYEIVRELGAGGSGTVYRAVDTARGRPAALKVLHARLGGHDAPLERFLREARLQALLGHPGIARVYDTGALPDGRAYIAMELLEGKDLGAHLRERGRLDPAETVAILTPLCAALQAAHERGIVHRDVKASNVFLAGDRVVLLDFGIARAPDAAGLTRDGQAVGTRPSMAPEQIRGGPIDPRTDVYLLGLLAFHMLTGAPPWADVPRGLVAEMHLAAPRPRPSERAPAARALDGAIARALSRDPADRPADAAAFLESLRAAAPTPALAAHLQVWADGHAGDDDQALIADMDVVLATAARAGRARGFVPALETSDSVLLVRPLADAARAASVDDLRAIHEALATRPGRHPALRVGMCLRIGTVARDAGGAFRGELCDAPPAPIAGLTGAPEVFAGLAVPTEPAGVAGLVRVTATE